MLLKVSVTTVFVPVPFPFIGIFPLPFQAQFICSSENPGTLMDDSLQQRTCCHHPMQLPEFLSDFIPMAQWAGGWASSSGGRWATVLC